MIESNYGKDIKNDYLKYLYKKYTNHIINFEKHAEALYTNWVIDIAKRNVILQKLDIMIRSMIKIYNMELMKIQMNPDKQVAWCTDIHESLDMINFLETRSFKDNVFNNIRSELITLCKENGSVSLDSFFCIYFNNQYHYVIDKCDLFELYNQVFIPISVVIEETNERGSHFSVNKAESVYDSLIDNTCTITITAKTTRFIFEGYISTDILNIYLRTSQIYAKHIFEIKSQCRDIIKEEYPEVHSSFLAKYSRFARSNIYFTNNARELTDKVIADYHLYIDVSSKTFSLVMKEFINSNIRDMYTVINLLLMGNEQNISVATLLFNLLKDRKVSGESASNIIYANLSFYSQIRIKKTTSNIKNEISRLKLLTPENISIEKRLAVLTHMPDNVKSYILEKVNEIKTGENNYKLQMAVNGLMQFPWKPKDSKNEFSDIRKSMEKSRDYLQNVAKKLDEHVYGHEVSKKELIELVGKWIQNPESTGQVIGLQGYPGTGKTLLAKSISSALNIPLSIVGLGGMSDSADLIGHSFTYAGAQYGMIVRQMIKAGNWRCVMLFDEVDKVSKRNDTNEIYNTLIHITDPNMNQHFQDRFYSSSVEFDLSGVLIVFSYNDSSKLDPILFDRIKEIRLPAYSTVEKILIAQDYSLKELCKNIGFDRTKIEFDDTIIRYIIEKYTIEAGVRELRRKIEQILLKLNIDRFYLRGPFIGLMKKKYIELHPGNELDLDESSEATDDNDDKKNNLALYVSYRKNKLEDHLDKKTLNQIFNLEIEDKIVITQDIVYRYLDKPIISTEEIHNTNLVGVVNGLYATQLGMGGIISIQIYKNFVGDPNGTHLKLKLTGNQKKVMRESVICALTVAVNILHDDIKTNIMRKFPNGFHIHAPDGGTPKDGPSAGCAFATAFVSILLNKQINHMVAMTGEIELTGKISKIGGLDLKLMGAKKAGVKCVYICEENKEDYEKIRKKTPEIFDDNFEIKIAKNIIDIVSDPSVIIGIESSDFNLKN